MTKYRIILAKNLKDRDIFRINGENKFYRFKTSYNDKFFYSDVSGWTSMIIQSGDKNTVVAVKITENT